MFLLFPAAGYIAIVTSAVMLGVLWTSGDVGWRHGTVALGWLIAAGYCRFYGTSMVTAAEPGATAQRSKGDSESVQHVGLDGEPGGAVGPRAPRF